MLFNINDKAMEGVEGEDNIHMASRLGYKVVGGESKVKEGLETVKNT